MRKINVKPTFIKTESGEKELIVVLSDVTERENAIVHRRDTTALMAIILILVCFYVFFFKFCTTVIPGVISYAAMTKYALFVMLLISVLIIKKTSLNVKLISKGPTAKKGILIGLGATAGVIGFMILLKVFLLSINSSLFSKGEPFFNFSKFTLNDIYWYPFSVLIQEFLARSIMQQCFI